MKLKATYLLITATLAVLWIPLAGFRSISGPAQVDGILWSSTRRLTWADFTGAVNQSSTMKAETYSRIEYTYTCKGGRMQAEVIAKFVPGKSWVKPGPSERLLRHEQGHFDITEYYARRLRRQLENLVDGCERGRYYVDEEAQKLFREWDLRQDQYDQETDHGRDFESQDLWLKRISKELDSMEDYAAE